MKRRGIMGILLLGLILITVTACGSDDKETTNQQPAEDDINVTITADGNIEASREAKLTFGTGGVVEKIHVEKYDEVKKGDLLAELDMSPLEFALTQSELARSQAQLAVIQAEVGQQQAMASKLQAEATVSQAEATLLQAKGEILQAKATIAQTKAAVVQAEATRAQAQAALIQVEYNLKQYMMWLDMYSDQVQLAQAQIKSAEAQLEATEAQFDAAQAQYDATQEQPAAAEVEVATAELQLESAQLQLELVERQVDIADVQLESAELQLEAAKQGVSEAEEAIQKAIITAPFDGTVCKVGVEEGEFLSPAAFTGRSVIEISDLSHMELVARVDELDIAKVETGQKVMISVDAIPEAKLEGRVTFISPVAREPVGVVLFEDDDEVENYEVKIDFDIPDDLPIRAGMSATAEIIVE